MDPNKPHEFNSMKDEVFTCVDCENNIDHPLHFHDVKDLVEQLRLAKKIIASHDLCHDMQGNVGPKEFAQGCADLQRKHFGCAPHEDEVEKLRKENKKLKKLLKAKK